MINDKRLFLLDAMALIYRAFYAMNKNPRITSKGLNTSAILGFANTLYDLIKNEKPTHIGVAFDTHAPTVRHIDFVAYKANRQETPEDLLKSIPYIMQLIEAFGIPILFMDGYEADDVIGTLAKKAEENGYTTYMVTSDKDFGQLVSEKTFIYKPGRMGEKAEIMGIEAVCKKFGIKRTTQVIDMLGLWGDASDNIPGIPGVGEVTARKLLEEFDNVDNIIANADKIANPKLREKVITYADQAKVSRDLATIILDVPVEFHEEKLRLERPKEKELKQLLEELEFRAFAKRVFTDLSLSDNVVNTNTNIPDLFSGLNENFADENPEISTKKTIYTTPHHYLLIESEAELKWMIVNLLQQKSICFDTETTGIDPNNSELVGISFCFKPGEAYYIPLPEAYGETLEILSLLKPIFENENIEKIGQNIKFDIAILKWYDVEVKGRIFDTMIAHYLLQPDMKHNMDILAETYLNYSPVSIETLIGKKGKNQGNMRGVETETIKEYAAEDADITFQLKQIFEPMLATANISSLFEDVEMPLIPVLAAMEAEGVKVDIDILNAYSIELLTEIQQTEKEIFELAGTTFNVASPKQLGEILFEHLKIIDNPKHTKTKQYSTGEDVLQKLLNKHPIIQKILDFRSLSKLKSTYVDSLPTMFNPRTGRIHTSYNQAVAATGRLSSNNPNLQNIPIRTEKGREIRKTFVPRNEDYVMLSADYSQIELRIIASLSGDENMLAAFTNNLDIHTATAANVYGVKLEDVTSDMRRNAKTVNFGIIYGISAFGLSERLSIPRKEAAQIIEQYFLKYPKVKEYMDKSIANARQNGYVETILGRRRYLRDINSSNFTVRGFAERNAINAPIQGSSADMIKIAMVKIYKALTDKNLQTKMIMQVHDELVFDVHKSEIDIVKPIIYNEMKNAMVLKVPIEVEMNTGDNWLAAH
ncbi:MAG: DNA polymerase I [Bacteroidetes bacterium]|nr:DNA polymerase I [Bacteroidota bacterium]